MAVWVLCCFFLFASAALDLTAFDADSPVIASGGAQNGSQLVAFISTRLEHSARFHPVLHSLNTMLNERGLQRAAYIDLSDPLSAKASARFAIKTLPSLLLFCPGAPIPIPIAYSVLRPAESYMAEIAEAVLRCDSLATVLANVNVLVFNTSAVGALLRDAALSTSELGASVEGDVESVARFSHGLEAGIANIDHSLQLLGIVQRRLEHAKVLAGQVAAGDSVSVTRSFNRERNYLMLAGYLTDKTEFMARLEAIGTLQEFLPSF